MAVASPVKALLVAQAKALGFDVCGVSSIQPELRADYYRRWIAEGQHGSMDWMERNNERRLNPASVLPEARSIVVVGMNHHQPVSQPRGRIAQYALGGDYHNLIYKRLKKLCAWLRDYGGEQKPYVDTGPVMEKPIAVAAGLGWQGKNTLLIHPRHGTWLFLGTIFTTLELETDLGYPDRCGSCSRCIDACPTGAITAPYQLDARRCIAYLTIEHHGAIPLEWRKAIGDHLYGCDDCLDVCPWNRWAAASREAVFDARERPDLRAMLGWTEEDFNRHFAGSPIRRLKLPRWLRNCCVVLGNCGTPEDLPALQVAADHPEPLVREHARWAIGEIEARY
jgi:epoxyqueuosine reductase